MGVLSVFRKLSCSVSMLRNIDGLHETVDVEKVIHFFFIIFSLCGGCNNLP